MNTILLLLAASVSLALADDADEVRHTAAKTVVNQITAGEYEAATEQFDDMVKRGLPAGTVQKVSEGRPVMRKADEAPSIEDDAPGKTRQSSDG